MCKIFLYYNVVLLVENLEERTGHGALSIRNQFGVKVGGLLSLMVFKCFQKHCTFIMNFLF